MAIDNRDYAEARQFSLETGNTMVAEVFGGLGFQEVSSIEDLDLSSEEQKNRNRSRQFSKSDHVKFFLIKKENGDCAKVLICVEPALPKPVFKAEFISQNFNKSGNDFSESELKDNLQLIISRLK